MSRRRTRFLLLLFAAAILLALTRGHWLAAVGAFLIKADQPAQADAILVLAGDRTGRRILKAAELIREGYAKYALVSGPCCIYDHFESTLAIDLAVRRGFERSVFVEVRNDSKSTLEEARAILPVLRARNIRKLVIVTSDYHTRRAGGIYRRVAGDLEFRMVAAPDDRFRPDSWWLDREAQKTVFLEYTKLITGLVGI